MMLLSLVAVRLFYDHLVEGGLRESNPVGRGRYTPGRGFAGHRECGLIPRFTKNTTHAALWLNARRRYLGVINAKKP